MTVESGDALVRRRRGADRRVGSVGRNQVAAVARRYLSLLLHETDAYAADLVRDLDRFDVLGTRWLLVHHDS